VRAIGQRHPIFVRTTAAAGQQRGEHYPQQASLCAHRIPPRKQYAATRRMFNAAA
jgi:hypothetical protein